MIFQDPQSSLNPRRRVAEIVAQPLRLHGRAATRAEARKSRWTPCWSGWRCARPMARAIPTSCPAGSASASASRGPSPCSRGWWWPTKSSPDSTSPAIGTMEMCRRFGPVLGGNGGGVVVNMLSILSRVNPPMIGTYCASKAATLSLTQGVRAELAAQGTLVVAVMPGAIDTRIGNMNPPPLEAPIDVANAALDAVEAGEEDIYPGVVAGGVSQGLAADPKGIEKQFAEYLPG